jgi:uncharacterized protein YqjF (DUF2071 family)
MANTVVRERQTFVGGASFSVLPDVNGGKLPQGTTPSVANSTHFICSAVAPVTITNFREGADYQEISLLGDGFSTVSHNISIKTNTGANKLLLVDKVYHFTKFGSLWVEDA